MSEKHFLRALKGEKPETTPIWFMRQAGRYLPEYLQTRMEAGSFLDLCYDSDKATEVTLQPIRRYGFDAAILFSDILVIPHALGQKLWFEEGTGPKLTALMGKEDLDKLDPSTANEKLAPVFETVSKLSASLPKETALIGFAGAPWTVASYMIEGGSSRDFHKGKLWAYGQTDLFQTLINLLVETTANYLIAQINAGAEALQLFDSWSGVWPEDQFHRWCLEPAKAIVERVKAVHPNTPIILFPRGAGPLYETVAIECRADGVSLDTTVPLDWARDRLAPHVALQGNLDPVYLLTGGKGMDQAIDRILEPLKSVPHIFNLGHGIDKNTPPENVARAIARIRNFDKT